MHMYMYLFREKCYRERLMLSPRHSAILFLASTCTHGFHMIHRIPFYVCLYKIREG